MYVDQNWTMYTKLDNRKAVLGEEGTNTEWYTTHHSLHSPLIFCVLLRVVVCPIHRVMHDHFLPLMLLLIKVRQTNVNMVAYISTATYLYSHWVLQMSDFTPLNKDEHSWWGHIKLVVRAIEVSTQLAKMSLDEFLDLTADVFSLYNTVFWDLWVHKRYC